MLLVIEGAGGLTWSGFFSTSVVRGLGLPPCCWGWTGVGLFPRGPNCPRMGGKEPEEAQVWEESTQRTGRSRHMGRWEGLLGTSHGTVSSSHTCPRHHSEARRRPETAKRLLGGGCR